MNKFKRIMYLRHSTPSGQKRRSHPKDIIVILLQHNNCACRSRCSKARTTNELNKGRRRATRARRHHAGECTSSPLTWYALLLYPTATYN